MANMFLAPNRIDLEIEGVLDALASGAGPHGSEREHVDVKEEPGRRGRGGVVQPGLSVNEAAAEHLTGELACMANTPGGGAIVLGASDRPLADGRVLIGTALDAEWLRRRIYELSGRRMTCDVRDVDVLGARLLVLRVPPAVEPIRWNNKIRWRVGDQCQEIDAATWMEQQLRRVGWDWSAQPSTLTVAEVSPLALEIARRFLRERAGDPDAEDLADADTAELLRRLNLVTGDGFLTRAGELLFVTTGFEAIDYMHRAYDGADSTGRVRGVASLVVQLWDVERAVDVNNPVEHLADGLAVGQVRRIPARAAREAIVNGVAHRDWTTPEPTVVEHTGDRLVVTSPGGFVSGINPGNILTHPSAPRYRSLAAALAGLRLAELEGIGVDRIVADQLGVGHPYPTISEIDGPAVRTVLVGGDPDRDWIGFLGDIVPPNDRRNVSVLLLLQHLVDTGWVDDDSAAPVLQRSPAEARAMLDRLVRSSWRDQPIVVSVAGVPPGASRALRFSDPVRRRLAARLAPLASPDGRRALVLGWARARTRVSSTEAADLLRLGSQRASQVLNQLKDDGLLVGNRDVMRGRGFAYLPPP
jgi:ATP-dependent DNA helicase RecG